MAKESGKTVLLKVGDGADPEVFTAVDGQKDTRLSLAASPVDVSDKNTDGWGATITGTKNATVTLSGVAVWPDTKGLKALQDAFQADELINCQLIMNAAGHKWSGPMAVTQLEIGGANDGATEYSITLQNAGALAWTTA